MPFGNALAEVRYVTYANLYRQESRRVVFHRRKIEINFPGEN
jgi:hypothetical protein